MPHEQILMRNVGVKNSTSIKVYKKAGGYKSLEKALKMSSDDLVEFVKGGNVRGRGGAGFPAGVKWGFLPPGPAALVTAMAGQAESMGLEGVFAAQVNSVPFLPLATGLLLLASGVLSQVFLRSEGLSASVWRLTAMASTYSPPIAACLPSILVANCRE